MSHELLSNFLTPILGAIAVTVGITASAIKLVGRTAAPASAAPTTVATLAEARAIPTQPKGVTKNGRQPE